MKKITVLSGGIGGARFLQGLRAHDPEAEITVVVNTADDAWLFGLRVCPDLDSVMYTLGGGIDPDRRWGRADETWHALEEFSAHGHHDAWFGLGDRDLATHVLRTHQLRGGADLTEVTADLCRRWQPGVTLLPMSDDEVETQLHVVRDGQEEWIHFQEWWIRYRAELPFAALRHASTDRARATDEVLVAIRDADVVLLAPSNPVVSIGPILSVRDIPDALSGARGPVVGVSPIIAGGHVRGMADQLLTGLGREVSAASVAEVYGSRGSKGLLDGWLVDTEDAALVDRVAAAGIKCRAVPLRMTDEEATARMAADALALAGTDDLT